MKRRRVGYRVADPRALATVLAVCGIKKREFAERHGYSDSYIRKVLTNHNVVSRPVLRAFLEEIRDVLFERLDEEESSAVEEGRESAGGD